VTSQGQRDTTRDRERLDSPLAETNEAAPEMSKLLEGRRWEIQDGPFRGFGSPPGRF
jgi:hypothetical protein